MMMRQGLLRLMAMLVAFAALGPATAEEAASERPSARIEVRQSTYTLPPFGAVAVYRPEGDPRGVVLLLSGKEGWNHDMEAMASSLAQQKLLVAGVSTPALLKALEQGGPCVDPNYALIKLARDVQHRMAIKTYTKPIIAGHDMGATMAYGGLSQWPNAAYLGVVSVGFTPTLRGHKPWCVAPGFVAHAVTRPVAGWQFVPGKQVKVPWTILQGRDDRPFDAAQAVRFVSGVPGARLIQVPGTVAGNSEAPPWLPQLQAAVSAMVPPPPRIEPGRIPIPDMPITLVPATRPGAMKDVMAVIYSGDGGWAGIDRDISAQLASAGIPVIGIDSLSYFWSARTPHGAGRDMSQIINGFSERWNRPKILLIGYSFGADAMPYMIANIDAAARAKIVSVSLLGLSATADFQFHLTSWLNMTSDEARPTIPAIVRLKGMTIRCVRGVTESESACTAIPKGIAQQFLVPGDHHFNRNASLLASIILGQRKPGAISR